MDYSDSPIAKSGKRQRTPRAEQRRRKGLNRSNPERRAWLREDQYGEAAVIVRAMPCVGCRPAVYRDASGAMMQVAAAYERVQRAICAGDEPPVLSDPHHVRHRSDSDATSLVPCCRPHHGDADEHKERFEYTHSVDLALIARWIAGPIALLLDSPDPGPEG